MTDSIDKASEFEALRRKIAQSNRQPEGPAPTGFCHFCGEPVAPGLRWCDTNCRDDWQREQNARGQRCQTA